MSSPIRPDRVAQRVGQRVLIDETHTWDSKRFAEEYVRTIARFRAERAEREMHSVLGEWLPRRLGWLADHPRLLRVWLVWPHRERPVFVHRFGAGSSVYLLVDDRSIIMRAIRRRGPAQVGDA